jgi:hypothetical protein
MSTLNRPLSLAWSRERGEEYRRPLDLSRRQGHLSTRLTSGLRHARKVEMAVQVAPGAAFGITQYRLSLQVARGVDSCRKVLQVRGASEEEPRQ